MRIERGFSPADRSRVAAIYWQAFAGKLGLPLGPEDRGCAFLARVMDPAHALVAVSGGQVQGVAGFKSAQGGFVGGGRADLAAIYGGWGSLWRMAILAFLERAPPDDLLLMDGIAVHPQARGQGAGSALLAAIKAEAGARGLSGVRLDVIDSNPRARALYERHGFVAGKTEDIGPLRWLFGFRHATEMSWRGPDRA